MVEVVREQVECRVRDDFCDLGIGDSRDTCRGEVTVGDESTVLDQLSRELQDGVGLAIDSGATTGVANLLGR